jgi:hypothetical protein
MHSRRARQARASQNLLDVAKIMHKNAAFLNKIAIFSKKSSRLRKKYFVGLTR